MASKHKRNRSSDQTVAEAMRISKANQRPGQTKEQTKLIAQGIQKGIEQYKKQQKIKARERDRLRKKSLSADSGLKIEDSENALLKDGGLHQRHRLIPWVLLLITWLGIGFYFLFASTN